VNVLGDQHAGAASSRDRVAPGRVIGSTNLHGRANLQAGPAARQAGKEVKRERIKICRIACISRLSGSERSEGMRFALEITLSPVPAGLAGATLSEGLSRDELGTGGRSRPP